MGSSAFELLSKDVRRIASELGLERETEIQSRAIPAILGGENVLIIAPTGSGKTEAALLPILEQMNLEREKGGIRAIYITPLRVLNRDMLRRIEAWARRLDLKVEVRHGDTPQKQRRSQSLHPPDILVTTPETLQAILIGSRLRKHLSNLRWVVVDEIHELASDRRGAQLAIGLERLVRVVGGNDFQRIGLSATVANSNEVASFLSGAERRFRIIDGSIIQKLSEYRTEFAEPTQEDVKQSRELFVSEQQMARIQRMADLLSSHDSTLIFVNSRTNAESLASKFGLLGLKVGVHHGSLPREERERVEEEFKTGALRAMVCTSTMELGIDIGSVDLVIQYMSPRQVNSLIQRVGRSGHSLSRKSEGIILSVSPEDSLESIVLASEAAKKNLEPVLMHDCPLDVLAHQVAGLLMESGELKVSDYLDLFRRAFQFRALSMDKLMSVLTYMEKLGYLSVENDLVVRKKKCREYYLQNLSMIPDERRYAAIDLSTQQRVGILGEEFMIIHAKVGVHFVIKGRVWQIESIQGESVYVTPVEDPTAAIPGWDGELLPIPERVACLVGHERAFIESKLDRGTDDLLGLTKGWNADRSARSGIISEVQRQVEGSAVPTDARVVAERFDRFLIMHTSAGDRINRTLGELFEEVLLRQGLVRHWWNDGYRILFELTTAEFDISEVVGRLFKYDDKTEGFLRAVISKHFPFGYQMKFIAERFGALNRGLMLSEEALKELVVKFRFTPIYNETMREALATQVDLPGALKLLRGCSNKTRELKVLESTSRPSPLTLYIMSRYAEFDELSGPENLNSIDSMKSAVSNEVVSLLCFNCSNLREFVRVAELDDPPRCSGCDSPLLSVLFYGARFAKSALDKKRSGKKLTEEESEMIARARRSADIVLSYGKKGVLALSIYGVGPQTAAKVLSRMHDTEEALYGDLLAAKLKFIETKQYWD